MLLRRHVSQKSFNMNLPINGSGTSLLWIGGKVFGSMKVSLHGCPGTLVIDSTLNGKSGKLMLRYTPYLYQILITGQFAIGIEIRWIEIKSSN